MLRRWFKPSQGQTQDGKTQRQVALSLLDAQRAHALIDVAVDGEHYQSIIIGVDPAAGTVTIDELFPRGFVGRPGQVLTVGVRLDGGRRLGFVTRIIERGNSDDAVEFYQLMMPETIDHNQRRGAFRLKLDEDWAMRSEFRAPDRRRRVATVRDLSAGGIRLALTDAALPENVSEGDLLDPLRFEFAGRHFQCRAAVRNVGRDARGDTVIGAAFRGLSRFERRSLERLILQAQRESEQRH